VKRDGAALAVPDWYKLALLLLFKERTATETKDNVQMDKTLVEMVDV
jgi:hypothetical protein